MPAARPRRKPEMRGGVKGVRPQRPRRFAGPEDELPADGMELLERVVERKMSAAVPVKALGPAPARRE